MKVYKKKSTFSIINQLNETNSELAKKLIENLILDKERVFIFEDNKEYSGIHLLEKINKKSKKLFSNKNKIVILNSKNTTDWVITYIAAKLVNKVIFIVSDKIQKKLINKINENFSISGVFKNNKLYINEKKRNLNKNHIFNDKKAYDCIFTSGTSGKPKAVCIEEDSYIYVAKLLIKKSKQTKDDIELLSMPFSHSFGIARLRASILNNQSFFVSDGLKNFPKIYKMFFKININGLSLVPAAIEIVKFMLRNEVKKFAAKIKYFEIGSSSLSDTNRKWLKDNFLTTNIFHHYGMTEASRSFFINRGNKDKVSISNNNVGNPAEGIAFKLRNMKNYKNKNIGEILIKGPHLAAGYFLINKKIEFVKISKWYKSGDIGSINNKELILLGRVNSMINVGGHKVYSEEIEEIVNKLDPIKDSICSSILDKVYGEVPGLIIEKKRNLQISDNEVIIKINKIFRSYPSYKRPKKIICTSKLPLTSNGKKIRNKNVIQKFF